MHEDIGAASQTLKAVLNLEQGYKKNRF